MIPSIVKQTCWKVAKVDSHEIRCAFAFTTLINTYIFSTRHENWNYTDYLNLNGDLTRTKKEIFICLPTYLLYIFNIFYYSTFLYARLLTFFFGSAVIFESTLMNICWFERWIICWFGLMETTSGLRIYENHMKRHSASKKSCHK